VTSCRRDDFFFWDILRTDATAIEDIIIIIHAFDHFYFKIVRVMRNAALEYL